MRKENKIKNFDTNGIGQLNAGMFGLPFTLKECDTVLIPVPWEVTVSYGGGTADGPAAILEASYQVDLYDPFVKDAWKTGIWMDKIDDDVRGRSDNARRIAEHHIQLLSEGANPEADEQKKTVTSIT